MNKVTLNTIAISTVLICSSYASASQFATNYYEKDLIKICESAKDNKVSKLKRQVRQLGVSYKKLQNRLKCNGVTLMDFAIEHNAEETAMHIARKASIDPDVVIAKLNKSKEETETSSS